MADLLGSFLTSISKENVPVPKVYSKKVLTNETKKKLLPYQNKHVIRIITILLKNHICLDASDTGVGKTYSACATCKELGKKPIIFCPKTLIFIWMSVLDFFGVEYYDIVNYETIQNGKTYVNSKCKSRKEAFYLQVVDPDPDNPHASIYQWDVPEDAMIIFDETHRCKRPNTFNGKLLMSTKQLIDLKIPVLLLSATICEKLADMKILFYLFGFIPNTRNYNHYCRTLQHTYPQYRIKRSHYKNKNKVELQNARDNAQAMMIFEEIKDFTSRIRIKDLGDNFPSNQWSAQQFFAEEADKIAEAYEEIAKHMAALKNKMDTGSNHHLAIIQKLKQEIELQKVPIFIEQAQLYLDEGKSVIIFVNYLDTLNLLVEELGIKCQVRGGQKMEERLEAIDLFQANIERIIICQIRAGGVGIGLHDIHGQHPRVTLINYPDSAADLLQALGRAPRSGAKSPVLQRIIFVANVDYEKRIMQNINRKLTNISAINDGDLDGYKYKVKRITRKVVEKNKIIADAQDKIDDDL
jgi:superfamily II DNA or RNA helicase